MDRSEIRDQIRLATIVEDTNVTDTQLNLIINQGVEEVAAAFHWPWLEASATITLSDSTQTYALASVASDFNTAVALVDDDNDNRVEFIAPSKFFQLVGNDTGNESDTPDYWTIWEDKIYLSPIPSANDTNRLTLYYYKNPTTLSTDSTAPEWDVAFHWALVEYGKWKLWEREEYFEQADKSQRRFVQYVSDMMTFYTARVKRSPFLYGDGLSGLRIGDINIPSLWRI